jgi:multicomponent Na+:H+ antiporter subunit E
MSRRQSPVRMLPLVALLAGIWYLLSGKADLLNLGAGLVTAVVVAATFGRIADVTEFRGWQFLRYLPWLVVQVLISNLRVARVVLAPGMPIAPSFVGQHPGVVGPRALTLLGISVTLTPGTLAVEIGPDELFVHALDPLSAADVREGIMARRVAGVFPDAARR